MELPEECRNDIYSLHIHFMHEKINNDILLNRAETTSQHVFDPEFNNICRSIGDNLRVEFKNVLTKLYAIHLFLANNVIARRKDILGIINCGAILYIPRTGDRLHKFFLQDTRSEYDLVYYKSLRSQINNPQPTNSIKGYVNEINECLPTDQGITENELKLILRYVMGNKVQQDENYFRKYTIYGINHTFITIINPDGSTDIIVKHHDHNDDEDNENVKRGTTKKIKILNAMITLDKNKDITHIQPVVIYSKDTKGNKNGSLTPPGSWFNKLILNPNIFSRTTPRELYWAPYKGKNLREVIEKPSTLDKKDIVKKLHDKYLQRINDSSVPHADVKLENTTLDKNGEVHFIDSDMEYHENGTVVATYYPRDNFHCKDPEKVSILGLTYMYFQIFNRELDQSLDMSKKLGQYGIENLDFSGNENVPFADELNKANKGELTIDELTVAVKRHCEKSSMNKRTFGSVFNLRWTKRW